MTNKQIIKPRPICLYEDTCLHLKEKTRLCEDCVHHKNYWSELLEKEQVEKIKSLEQERAKIKNWVKGMMFYTDCSNWFERFTTAFENWKNDLISQLDQLKAENEKLKKYLNQIRDEELSHLDIEWDEYETSTRQEDYSNIITLVERALGEIDD